MIGHINESTRHSTVSLAVTVSTALVVRCVLAVAPRSLWMEAQ